MANKPFTGLLQDYGLPSMSQEELLQKRQLARAQESIAYGDQMAREMNPMESGAYRIGSRLGAIIGSKVSPEKLSPDETRQMKIVDDANQSFAKLMTDPKFMHADTKDKELEYESVLAQSAAANGDYALAAKMASSVGDKRVARKLQELELRKLEGDISRNELDTELLTEEGRRARAGEFGTWVIPKDDGAFDVMNPESSVVTGRINENGLLEVMDPQGRVIDTYNQFLSREDALAFQKAAMERQKETGKGGVDPKILKDFMPGLSERKSLREQRSALANQGVIMDAMANEFGSIMDQGMDPTAIMQDPGWVISGISNVVSTVRGSLAGFQQPAVVVDADGKVIGGAKTGMEWVDRQGYGDLVDQIKLPMHMRMTAAQAQNFRAQIVELAYTIARANEPGARQLSDNDFKQALVQLGAASDDPIGLAMVLTSNYDRQMEKFQETQRSYHGAASLVGISPEAFDVGIHGGEYARLQLQYGDVKDKWGKVTRRLTGGEQMADDVLNLLPPAQ